MIMSIKIKLPLHIVAQNPHGCVLNTQIYVLSFSVHFLTLKIHTLATVLVIFYKISG
jgi:hypothetical protein